MLKISNLTFSYNGKREIISNLSLDFSQGGVYGLLGSNGAGKSTLLYLVAGLLTPDSGCAEFDGVNTRRRLPKTVSELMLVPEEFNLPKISLKDYVKVNSVFYPRFSEEDFKRNMTCFELESDLHLGALSMGQKKKVILAFAMACHTRVLLMDEPTNGLDIPAKSAFRRIVAESADEDSIYVISTHQVRDIGQILDRVVIMNNSRILMNETMSRIQSTLRFGTTSDVAEIERALYAQKAFAGANVILPCDGPGETEVNLELLFEFAVQNPTKLAEIFKR